MYGAEGMGGEGAAGQVNDAGVGGWGGHNRAASQGTHTSTHTEVVVCGGGGHGAGGLTWQAQT